MQTKPLFRYRCRAQAVAVNQLPGVYSACLTTYLLHLLGFASCCGFGLLGQCYVVRNKSGKNMFHPKYTVYLEDGDRQILSGKVHSWRGLCVVCECVVLSVVLCRVVSSCVVLCCPV